MAKLKGIVVFYINLYPDLGQQLEPTLLSIKEMNRPLMEQLSADNYACILVPTTKEATRVEKVDYDAPFPRYMPKSIDVNKHGLKTNRKFSVFQDVADNNTNKGFITLFVNFHPEIKLVPNEVLKLVQSINQESLQKISEDGQYQLMIVPTTKEATRVEKVDYDMPFPRLAPKAVSKTKAGIVTPKVVKTVGEDEEEDGPHDEIDDEELEQEGKE